MIQSSKKEAKVGFLILNGPFQSRFNDLYDENTKIQIRQMIYDYQSKIYDYQKLNHNPQSIEEIAAYAYKYRLQRKLWLLSILSLMSVCLLSNIIFCFFNDQYWLYAVQNYSYNLYFLFIVGFVCRAYVLKFRSNRLDLLSGGSMSQQTTQTRKNRQKIIFYCIFISAVALYTGIFILSIMKEVSSQRDNDSGKKIRYCEEVQYLCFDVLCTIMSIIVLIILHMNQIQEKLKIDGFQSVVRNRPRGSLLSDENQKMVNDDEGTKLQGKLHNPLGTLWIWVLTNVVCQVLSLVQSGLLLQAIPSQCLIIESNPAASNYLDLLFTILTMYMGFGVTLWYVINVKLIRERSAIDRTVTFSQQVKIDGNIQLFNPSREETVFIL